MEWFTRQIADHISYENGVVLKRQKLQFKITLSDLNPTGKCPTVLDLASV